MNLWSSIESRGVKVAPWPLNNSMSILAHGNCSALVLILDSTLMIVTIANETPGNGDFSVLLSALESACQENGCSIQFVGMTNRVFARHLNESRGYRIEHDEDKGLFVIKEFNRAKA